MATVSAVSCQFRWIHWLRPSALVHLLAPGKWTEWNLAVTVPWQQHYKQCPLLLLLLLRKHFCWGVETMWLILETLDVTYSHTSLENYQHIWLYLIFGCAIHTPVTAACAWLARSNTILPCRTTHILSCQTLQLCRCHCSMTHIRSMKLYSKTIFWKCMLCNMYLHTTSSIFVQTLDYAPTFLQTLIHIPFSFIYNLHKKWIAKSVCIKDYSRSYQWIFWQSFVKEFIIAWTKCDKILTQSGFFSKAVLCICQVAAPFSSEVWDIWSITYTCSINQLHHSYQTTRCHISNFLELFGCVFTGCPFILLHLLPMLKMEVMLAHLSILHPQQWWIIWKAPCIVHATFNRNFPGKIVLDGSTSC